MITVKTLTISHFINLKQQCADNNTDFDTAVVSLIKTGLADPANPTPEELDAIAALIVAMKVPPLSYDFNIANISKPTTQDLENMVDTTVTTAPTIPATDEAQVLTGADADLEALPETTDSSSSSDQDHRWYALGGSLGASAVTMLFGGRGVTVSDSLVAGASAGISYAAAQYLDDKIDTSEVNEYLTGAIAVCGGALISFAAHAGVAAILSSNETEAEAPVVELPSEPAEVVNQFGL